MNNHVKRNQPKVQLLLKSDFEKSKMLPEMFLLNVMLQKKRKQMQKTESDSVWVMYAFLTCLNLTLTLNLVTSKTSLGNLNNAVRPVL